MAKNQRDTGTGKFTRWVIAGDTLTHCSSSVFSLWLNCFKVHSFVFASPGSPGVDDFPRGWRGGCPKVRV